MKTTTLLILLSTLVGFQQVAATAKNPQKACQQWLKDFGSKCKWKDPDGTRHYGHCNDGNEMACIEDDEWYSVYDPDEKYKDHKHKHHHHHHHHHHHDDDYEDQKLHRRADAPTHLGRDARTACIDGHGGSMSWAIKCAYFDGAHLISGYCSAAQEAEGKRCLSADSWHQSYDPNHRIHRAGEALEWLDNLGIEQEANA